MPSVAGVAQSVEQHIRNVWVGGSIPPIGFIFQALAKTIYAFFANCDGFVTVDKLALSA